MLDNIDELRHPPEFEAFAREQVNAGAYASQEEAVAAALRDSLAQVGALRAEVQRGLASLDRGEGLDGEAATRDLIAETRRRHGE